MYHRFKYLNKFKKKVKDHGFSHEIKNDEETKEAAVAALSYYFYYYDNIYALFIFKSEIFVFTIIIYYTYEYM